MIVPLDERPNVITVTVDDAVTVPPTVSAESESSASISDDGTPTGVLTVKPELANEDCPGSRIGDGCE